MSRGLLRSTEAPGDQSGKRYYREDLERLKKADARRGHGPAAASAVRFGPPIIETSITEIAYRGPIYRGVSAQDMIDNNWAFPEVVEHLWKTEQLDWSTPETEPNLTLNRIFERLHERIHNEEPVAREPEEVKASAAALLTALVGGGKQAANLAFSERLLHSLGLEKPNPEQVEVIRQTLIFLADHAMNTSTLAVRAAASTGASLYSALMACLSAFNGPKHGLAPKLIVEWSQSPGNEPLDSESKRAELTQWFDHPSYPNGIDPRADHLLEYLDANELLPASIQSLLADAEKLELGHPSTDIPLASIELAFDLERDASSAIFAISRMAGWVAHYIEQLEQDFLIRPNSEFRGDIN